jgi:dextranase
LISANGWRLLIALILFISLSFGDEIFESVDTDKACYNPGDSVRFSLHLREQPESSHLFISYRHLFERIDSISIPVINREINWSWLPPGEDYRGYLAEIFLMNNEDTIDRINIGVDVSSDWRRYPRYGFLSKYPNTTSEEREAIINKLNRYHINGLQFYDWHWKHHRPLCGTVDNPAYTWNDIANRKIYCKTVEGYISLAHAKNMKTMAYNLIYGAYEDASNDSVQETWRLFTDRAHQYPDKHDLPDSWASDIYLMNPANSIWQSYINCEMNKVFQAFDFDGWHMDQLGNRGTRYDYSGNQINISGSFRSFIEQSKNALNVSLVLNAVDQYGQPEIAVSPVDFLYTEVWSETTYSGLAGIIHSNDYYSYNQLASVLAAYVNKGISGEPGTINTAAVLLADAVIFANGGAHLELGEHILCNEYFPNDNLKMDEELVKQLIAYYDFSVAYENILRDHPQPILFGIMTDSDVPLSKSAQKDKVWVFAGQAGNRQIYHFINFIGVSTMDWRDPQAIQTSPEKLFDLPLMIKADSTVSRVWTTSPDTNQGSPVGLDFTQNGDTLSFTLPGLHYWSMVVVEFDKSSSAVQTEAENMPAEIKLGKNYPNPFNPATSIPFIINNDGEIIFKVINLKGQTVFETESFYRTGNHEIRFNAKKLCSGIYMYSISNKNATCCKKMLLIK